MSSILSIFNIAKSSLFANQTGLQVTSNNIANVGTDGYSRQVISFDTNKPEQTPVGEVGTGVGVSVIKRVSDKFIEKQVAGEMQDMGRYEAKESILSRLDELANDKFGVPINASINEFFNASHDLVNNVEGVAERSTLLSKGKLLASNLNFQSDNFKTLKGNVDDLVQSTVTEVNNLATEIFRVNREVVRSELGGSAASNSRDKLQLLLNELSSKIDINYFENRDSGAVTVTTSGGITLVDKESIQTLTTVPDLSNEGTAMIGYTSGGGAFINVTSQVNNGALAGYLEARDVILPRVISDLDKLSASIANEVNIIHKAGFGLGGAGDTNNDFFRAPSVLSEIDLTNNGGATVTANSITDFSALTMNNYELRFTNATTFNLVNADTNVNISTGNAYTSGANIDFEGIRVVLTDTTGTPAVGDVFQVSTSKNAAELMDVTLANFTSIAASGTSANLPGDNANMIALSNLQNTKVINNNSETISNFYGSSVEYVGIQSQQANREVTAQQFILEQVENRRDIISGVSLDEEMTNLIIFQRGYEASAKLIAVTDELLQTVLNLV